MAEIPLSGRTGRTNCVWAVYVVDPRRCKCEETSGNETAQPPERVRPLRSDRRDRQQGGDGRTPESRRVLPVRRARRDRHERRSGQSVPCRHHLPVLKESAVTEPGSPPRAAVAEVTGSPRVDRTPPQES